MYLDRRTTAEMLGVSVSTLARAATDVAFGDRAEASGLLPSMVSNQGPVRYALDDIRAALANREVAAMAGRLRARQSKKRGAE